jgi:biopolymer transport protein ExbB
MLTKEHPIRTWLTALAGRSALVLGASLCFAAPLLAAAQQAESTDKGMSILGLVKASGVVGYVIIALSVVALAMVIENVLSLRRDKLAPPELIDEVQSLFDEGRYQEAMELCEAENNFFARICSAGISKIGHSFDTVQAALQEMGDEETVKLHQKIGWLSVIGNTAPMLGLFGTVQGMIQSFQKIATTVNPSPAALAEGIYVALLTTLFGLMVAIPVIAAFAFVRNRLVISVIEIGAIAEDLFERFRPQT